MSDFAVSRRWIVISTLAGLLKGQSGGRFEESKRAALANLDNNQYDRAAAKLEEIWEQSQTDPDVAEWLALAYLNGQDRQYHPEVEAKARDLMRQSLEMGGKATFLVQHSHEKLGWLQGRTITNYCSGKLSVMRDRLIFVATARRGMEEHSFDVPASEVRISGPAPDDDRGAFQIKTKSKNYNMAPRTRNRIDSEMFLTLAQQQFNGK